MELRATLLGNHARNVRNARNARNVRARARNAGSTSARQLAAAHRKSPGLVPRGYGTRPGPGQRLSAGALTP